MHPLTADHGRARLDAHQLSGCALARVAVKDDQVGMFTRLEHAERRLTVNDECAAGRVHLQRLIRCEALIRTELVPCTVVRLIALAMPIHGLCVATGESDEPASGTPRFRYVLIGIIRLARSRPSDV